MEDRIKNLEGCPRRDKFKRWHKDGPRDFYALDNDLVLVQKYPVPHIVCVIDHKPMHERLRLRFTHVLTYSCYLEKGIPVYMVETSDDLTRFRVYQYIGGDYRPDPPRFETTLVLEGGVSEYWEWERNIRKERQRQIMQSGML